MESGFVTNAAAPASSFIDCWSAARLFEKALIRMTTGMSFFGSSSRSVRARSIPLPSGRMMSDSRRWGRKALAASSP